MYKTVSLSERVCGRDIRHLSWMCLIGSELTKMLVCIQISVGSLYSAEDQTISWRGKEGSGFLLSEM